MTDYPMAYAEVLEILKYLPINEYKRIPKEEIEFYENNKDATYKFSYNPNLSLKEQNVSKKTKAILVTIYRDFFLKDEQKEKLNQILYYNEQIKYNKMKETYSVEKMFQKRKEEKENQLIVVNEKQSILKKILLKLKNWIS